MADEKPPAKPGDESAADPHRPAADDERTVVAPRGKPGPPAPADDMDVERTVMFRRPAEPPARPAAPTAVDDRTVVGRAAPRGSLAASAAASWQIVVLSGQAQGRRFPISGKQALIGSDPTCDAAIPGIEAVHVKLIKALGAYEMQNVGSSGSVTLAGGKRPSRAPLASGDLVKIGPVVLRFVQMGDIFSPDYSDGDFAAAAVGRFLDPERLREYRWVLVIGGLALLFALVMLLRHG